MNVITLPGATICEGCGMTMGTQKFKEWDPNVSHLLVVCGNRQCLREGKVLKLPISRVSCAPHVIAPEKSLVLPN